MSNKIQCEVEVYGGRCKRDAQVKIDVSSEGREIYTCRVHASGITERGRRLGFAYKVEPITDKP